MINRNRKKSESVALLSRLRRDIAGTTLAMMAAWLIPLAALTGSAVDVSRGYLVKVRLQQACDAGALAGRKFMTATSGTTLDSNAQTQASAFFANNFRSGWMGTTNVTFNATRASDGQVNAAATATLPLAIMKMFGFSSTQLSANCSARLDIGDSDIMFVLDTTGSMAYLTSDGSSPSGQPVDSYTRSDGTTGYHVREKSGSKISALRSAVLLFYDTLAANADPAAHIRYGFVPYTSTANVGYLLPQNYLVDSWTYQSRWVLGDSVRSTSTVSTTTSTSQATCNSRAVARSPSTGYTSSGNATDTVVSWTSNNGGTCVTTRRTLQPNWRYGAKTYDVSAFKTGAAVTDPSKVTGATTHWQGCIEERDTTAGTTSFNINSLPADLDPDLVPNNDSTRWRPMWHDVVYYRGNNTTVDDSGSSTNAYGDNSSTTVTGQFTNMLMSGNMSSGYVSCGKSAKELSVMTRSQVNSFITDPDFVPQGGTYHDTGMIWGLRLISPTGIFGSDTAAWAGNASPNRYIVFMTDGDMSPNEQLYGMYGMEYYDGRVTGVTRSTSIPNYSNYHNARFQAECSAAKARNITVFVVAFGQSLTTDLTNCATPGYAYQASSNAALQTAFQSIALQVAKLRLSQ